MFSHGGLYVQSILRRTLLKCSSLWVTSTSATLGALGFLQSILLNNTYTFRNKLSYPYLFSRDADNLYGSQHYKDEDCTCSYELNMVIFQSNNTLSHVQTISELIWEAFRYRQQLFSTMPFDPFEETSDLVSQKKSWYLRYGRDQ